MTDQPAVKRPEFSPRSVAVSLWSHKIAIAVTWIVISVLTVLVVLRLPKVYQAEATVLVYQQAIPEKFVTSGVVSELQTRLELLKQRALSVDVLTKLMTEYKLYEAERQWMTREQVITRFRDDISMRLVNGWSNDRPGTFIVGYSGLDPVVVADLTNRIAQFFIDGNVRDRQDVATGTVEFLSRELDRAKGDLDREDGRMHQLRTRFNGELPEQESALLASIAQLKAQLMAAQESLNGALQTRTFVINALDSAKASEAMTKHALDQQQREIARLRTARTALPVQATPPPAPSETDRLRQELDAARSRYSEEFPEVQRLRAALDRARAAEASKPTRPSGQPPPAPAAPDALEESPAGIDIAALPVLTEHEERRGNLNAQLAMLDEQIQDVVRERLRIAKELHELEARLARIPLHAQQLGTVSRDADVARTNYRSLLDKRLEADVTADLETRRRGERLELLDPARVPEQPVKPKRKLLASVGSLFGLLLGCLGAIAIEYRRGMILGEWELPETVTVLGRVPIFETEAARAHPAA